MAAQVLTFPTSKLSTRTPAQVPNLGRKYVPTCQGKKACSCPGGQVESWMVKKVLTSLPGQVVRLLPGWVVASVTSSSDGHTCHYLTNGYGHIPDAVGYATHTVYVGPLKSVVAASGRFHAVGIFTGLTRLHKGVWQLTPRE